jgi:hypothetical protein
MHWAERAESAAPGSHSNKCAGFAHVGADPRAPGARQLHATLRTFLARTAPRQRGRQAGGEHAWYRCWLVGSAAAAATATRSRCSVRRACSRGGRSRADPRRPLGDLAAP